MSVANKATSATSLVALATIAALAIVPGQSKAADPGAGHAGLVLEGAFEGGGDNIARIYYFNGDTQNLRAGQGGTVSVGAHYRPDASPWDFIATVGYKLIRTSDYRSDLGIDRIVVKFVGAYSLGHGMWVDVGPVWHTDVRLNGDGFVPDIKFDDGLGATIGVGWRWIGVTYTNMHYRSAVIGSVDASNAGVIFTWKF